VTRWLTPELHAALEQLARVPRLLVALDFDGTLAPEVDVPEEARALPEAQAAVERLRGMPGTRVALVSGRALDSLVHVSQLHDDVLLVGSHGIELRLGDPHAHPVLDATELARVDTLRVLLERVVEPFENVWLEPKPAGFAVHTRLAVAEDARRVHESALRDVPAVLENLTIRHGKNVLEFAVRSTTKGEAIEHLRQYTGADAVLYAGDDVTDEDAFATLRPGDLGLKSGEGETLAAFRVQGPHGVAAALTALAAFREE